MRCLLDMNSSKTKAVCRAMRRRVCLSRERRMASICVIFASGTEMESFPQSMIDANGRTLLLRSTLCSSPGPETSSNYYSTERKERKQGSAPAPAASENDISSSGAAPSKWSVLLGRYGRIAIGTHLVIGLTHLSCWYVAIRSGLDVNEMLLTYGGTVGETVLDRLPDGAGGFLLAYGIHKATSPVRMMVTVGATPVVASALGLQRKTPP